MRLLVAKMDRKQLNKFNMYCGVKGVTTDSKHQAAVASSSRFASHAADFRLLLPQIKTASKEARSLTTKSITETTETIREQLAELAVVVSSGAVALAKDIGDQEAAQSDHVTHSDIAYGRGSDSAEIADNLLAAAMARASLLEEYGLTPDILEDFDDLIQAYSDRIGRPRATIVRRKTIRASLPALFEAADKHLAQMDRIAVILKRNHPEFAAEYENHRRVVQLPGTRPDQEEAQTGPVADIPPVATKPPFTERTVLPPSPQPTPNAPSSSPPTDGVGLDA